MSLSKSVLISAVWSIVDTFLYDAYEIYMHGRFGQTLGKRTMELRVLSADGGPLRWQQAFRRNAVTLTFGCAALFVRTVEATSGVDVTGRIDTVTFIYISGIWLLAETTCALSTQKRQAIHDLIARSVVIRLNVPDEEFKKPRASA